MSAELRRLLSAATPGPWRHSPGSFPSDDGGFTSDDESYTATVLADDDSAPDAETVLVAACWVGDEGRESDADAALIVALVNAAPALLDVVEAARLLMSMHSQMGPAFEPHDEIELRAALARLEEAR